MRGMGKKGNSMLVQWLGLGVFTAMARVQPLVRGLRSHKPAMWPKKKKMRGNMDKLPMIAIEQGVLVEKCAKVGHLT